jgi:hypothetical protein
VQRHRGWWILPLTFPRHVNTRSRLGHFVYPYPLSHDATRPHSQALAHEVAQPDLAGPLQPGLPGLEGHPVRMREAEHNLVKLPTKPHLPGRTGPAPVDGGPRDGARACVSTYAWTHRTRLRSRVRRRVCRSHPTCVSHGIRGSVGPIAHHSARRWLGPPRGAMRGRHHDCDSSGAAPRFSCDLSCCGLGCRGRRRPAARGLPP